jgi:hypothetical protein
MNRPVVVALLFALMGTGCASMNTKLKREEPKVRVSGDWYTSERDRKINLPESTYSQGNFAVSIMRKYDDENQLRLLRIAESVYPSRDSVAKWRELVRKEGEPASNENEPDWSYLSFDDVRIPCAITSAAIEYYSNLVKAFEQGDFSQTAGLTINRCRVRYTGVIDKHRYFDAGGQRFPECFVARMELWWAYDCGDGCSLAFVKQRMVVMSPQGSVLAVLLDGPTDVERRLPAVAETPEETPAETPEPSVE